MKETTMELKVLGGGCANCDALEKKAIQALGQLGVEGKVEHITDFGEIAGYGVMNTPALVAGDKVVVAGRVPEVPELVSMLAGVTE